MGIFSKMGQTYRSVLGLYESKDNFAYSMASQMDLQKSEPVKEPKSQVTNAMDMISAMGYKDRPYSLSYDLLRQMATKNAVVAAIINTRVNQVSSFCTPVRFSRNGIGYEITLRDPEETPSKEDKDTMIEIEQFLERTGYSNDNSREDFDTFARKIVRDRLTFDQVTFEIVPDRKGRPGEFFAVDASTIRAASEDLDESVGWKEAEIPKNEEIKYVQVIDGTIQAYYTGNELAFGVSNPRTDINIQPYGFSELEMLINQITAHLWAEEYNSRFFSQGGTTKGILNLKPAKNEAGGIDPVDPQQLEAFKRQWLTQVQGMTGAWKTPILSVDGLEYLNVSQSNQEMEFEKWMNYLINIACAVFQIDPAEVNFPNRGGTGGTGGGLGDGGIEDRLKNSKDKGLRPLLRFVEMLINKYLVSRFDSRFVFSFTGMDEKSEQEREELNSKQVKVWKTVNELRKENDQPKLEDGDIILDPSYIQYRLQKEQQEQMASMGGIGGDEMGGGDNDNFAEQDDDTEKSEGSNKMDLKKYLTIEFEDD